MTLDTVEKWVRRAGGIGVLVFVLAMYLGLARAAHHPLGRRSGQAPGFVRGSWAFYIPASLVGYGLLARIWRPLPLKLPQTARAAALIVGAPLYFLGLALMLWGRFTLGEMYNVSTTMGAQLYADHRLVTAGPFRLMRHPMYLGGMLAEVGAFLLYRTWGTLFILINTPLLPIRARREEEALAAEFGEQWTEYARRVPMLLPRIG